MVLQNFYHLLNGAVNLQHQLVYLEEGQSIFDIGSTILVGADTNEKQIKRCYI
jgi:hypothetical protein